MKTFLRVITLSIALCSLSLFAQDTQNWYADDIYYSAHEKEINYLTIVFEEEEDYYEYIDSIEDYYQDNMSYSMRINRFHRDYYGSSINFNYGYFHDPYGFDYGFGCTFYNYPYNYGFGYGNYFGFNNWYNPWQSPWYYNQYAWNNPYGFNYGYGFGYGNNYNPYYTNTPFVYSTNSTYGHRSTLGNNTSNHSNTSGLITNRGRSAEVNSKPNTKKYKYDTSRRNIYQAQQTRSRTNFTPEKTSQTTQQKRVRRRSTNPTNTPTQKSSYRRKSTNTNKQHFNPSRSNNSIRSTNRPSSPSRRPR